jgi:cell division protein FtsQ
MRQRQIFFLSVFSLFFFIVLWQIWFYIVSLPLWNLQEIIILNNDYIPRNKISAQLSLPQEISILQINKKQLRRRLQLIPQIEDVSIKRHLPNTLLLDIRVKKPYIVMIIKEHTWLIDKHGDILNKEGVTPAFSKNLCWINGIVSISLIDQSLNTLKKLIDAIYLYLEKEQVTIDYQNPADINLYLKNKLFVRLGEPSHFTEKARNLFYVLDALGSRREMVKYIDMRAYQTPAVKFR